MNICCELSALDFMGNYLYGEDNISFELIFNNYIFLYEKRCYRKKIY